MSETLTSEDLQVLKAHFEADEHEFLQGKVYLKEFAITERIEQLDPAWGFKINSIKWRRNAGLGDKNAYTVTVHATMTIKGVSRDNTGMAVVSRTNQYTDNKTGEKKGGDSESNEAEKSATTDALKRCARLFGIGRYMLNMSGVKNMNALRQWLGQSNSPQQSSRGRANDGTATTPQRTQPTMVQGSSSSGDDSYQEIQNRRKKVFAHFDGTLSPGEVMGATKDLGIDWSTTKSDDIIAQLNAIPDAS